MAAFNIYQAKTQFSELLRRVRAGEEIVIADAGHPVAKLVPWSAPAPRRVLGADRGKVWIAPDAFEPLTEHDLATFYESPLFPAGSSGERARRKPRAARRGGTR